jgi:hypothetical protein
VPGPVPGRAEHLARGPAVADVTARRLGRPLDGRFADAQTGEHGEGRGRGLGEARQDAGQADDLAGRGRQRVDREPERLIRWDGSGASVGTMIVGAVEADRPEQADDRLGSIGDELGGVVAPRAAQAGPAIPPFPAVEGRPDRLGSGRVGQIAYLEFGLNEQTVVGLGGEQEGDLPVLILGGLAEGPVDPLGLGELFGGEVGSRGAHGGPYVRIEG